ncbi:ABC transporter G family member 20-like protein [Dinothrombium tinctorium]|uniref:ABC transporter G family member 20-like protein n=1 Tax=Dinothrombium tinctorium TaxID=1965070 RepID=A0A443QRI4_9ACAR|nr:ABC transporter G family member 20-like protein [Dinothrombium tinctorium]
MASATLFSFYYSRSKYEPDQFVSFDEDNSVALSSFKLLDPLTLAPSGNSYTPSIKESVPRIDNSVKESKFRIDNLDRSVEVKNVVLSYGKGKKSVPALRGINLSVPLGGIFNLPTLEEVFLRLCQLDPTDIELTKEAIETKNYLQQTLAVDNKPDVCTNTSPDINSSHKIKNGDIQTIVVSNGYANHDKKNTVLEQESSTYLNSYARTSALFHKNFLLPSIEVILFCICIGRDPFNIPIAVVNNESPADLSEWFLQTFDNNTIVQKNYISPESAIRAVKNGDSWAALIIGQNFSYALKLRTLLGGSVDNDTVIQSNIEVYLDMTNHLIGYKLQRTLLETFQKFAKEVLVSMSQNPAVVEIPIDFKPPVYGEREPTFTEFMAPGVLLSIAFLAAVALTTLAFVLERKEGLLERSLVAGVTSLEFLISHVLTQLLVLFVQVCLLLIFTFLVFNIPSRGNFFLVVLLTLLQGICGMAFGLMISSICKEENSATMLSLGSFYPNLLLSGTVWPTQAMPVFMRYFSYCLPQTLPIEAMRFILSRGWGMEYIEVTTGFVVTIAWTVFFLTSAVIIFKVKK